jgi:nucleoside diphosphate kinase
MKGIESQVGGKLSGTLDTAQTELTCVLAVDEGDTVERIFDHFSRRGHSLLMHKVHRPGRDALVQHFGALHETTHAKKMIDQLSLGSVATFVWMGVGVLHTGREVGCANVARGWLLGIDTCSASESAEAAARHIATWFPPLELEATDMPDIGVAFRFP